MKTPNLTAEELDTEITLRARLLHKRPNDAALKHELEMLRRRKMALWMREETKLADISDAMAKAADRARKLRVALDKVQAKVKKNCPCHGKVCQEATAGGRVCPAGVCARMN